MIGSNNVNPQEEIYKQLFDQLDLALRKDLWKSLVNAYYSPIKTYKWPKIAYYAAKNNHLSIIEYLLNNTPKFIQIFDEHRFVIKFVDWWYIARVADYYKNSTIYDYIIEHIDWNLQLYPSIMNECYGDVEYILDKCDFSTINHGMFYEIIVKLLDNGQLKLFNLINERTTIDFKRVLTYATMYQRRRCVDYLFNNHRAQL